MNNYRKDQAKNLLLSQSLEDYLKAILELKEEYREIRITDLAKKMKVAKSSVNQAIAKLSEFELIRHEKYGPLDLTATGEQKARQVKERHQILTRYFIECLKIEDNIAEQEACYIEHYLSPTTMEKLNIFLVSITGENQGCFSDNC